MANRFAVANGNFNDTNTWSATPSGAAGASVPGVGDNAYANGKTVTITADVACDLLSNGTGNSANAGGGFTCSDATRSINVIAITQTINIYTTVVTYTGTGTLTFGNVTLTTVYGGAVTNSGSGTCAFGTVVANVSGASALHVSISNTSSGSITITTLTTGLSSATAISNSSTGTVTITNATLAPSGAYGGHGISNSGNGTISITNATVTGGSVASSYGIYNSSGGTVTIANGIINGGSSNSGAAYGIYNASTGTLNLTGIFNATQYQQAVYSLSSSNVFICGSDYDYVNGVCAVVASRRVNGIPTGYSGPVNSVHRRSVNGSTTYVYYYQEGAASSQSGQALPANVRYGTTYGPTGNLTGTCYVPAPSSVASGVPVDNTTGTAVLTAQAVADAVYATAPTGQMLAIGAKIERLISGLTPTTGAVSGVGTTDTVFNTNLASSVDNFYKGLAVMFTSGALTGQLGQIKSYTGTTKTVFLQSALTSAPTPGDTFVLVSAAASRKLADFLATAMGSDNKVLLSANAQTGVTIPIVTNLTNAPDVSAALTSYGAAKTSDVTAVPGAVRTELAPELARTANCATVDSTGAQLAAL